MNCRRERYFKVVNQSWNGTTSVYGPFPNREQDQMSRKSVDISDLFALWPLKYIWIHSNEFYHTDSQHFSTGLDKYYAQVAMVTNVSQVIIFNFYVFASSRTQAEKRKHFVSQNITHTGSEMKAFCISEYNTHRLRNESVLYLRI
jgi:hypothetical protein